MDARARTVSEILHESAQYMVPLFQRSYSWHKPHWQKLSDDVMALADDPVREGHFLGQMVCTTVGKSGWRSAPETWGETHAAMVDAMIRLDRALRPHVHGLRL